MVWYQNLYIGRVAQARKDSLIEAIDSGAYPSGAYVVLVPANENCQLEILSAQEFRHPYVRKNCLMIGGLAYGKTEAESIVEAIVRDVWADRKDANIRAWLSEEHG